MFPKLIFSLNNVREEFDKFHGDIAWQNGGVLYDHIEGEQIWSNKLWSIQTSFGSGAFFLHELRGIVPPKQLV